MKDIKKLLKNAVNEINGTNKNKYWFLEPVQECMEIFKPDKELVKELTDLVFKHKLFAQVEDLYYHFNIGNWVVDLANTKKAMLNYDIYDVINSTSVDSPKEDGETETAYTRRIKEENRELHIQLRKMYDNYKETILIKAENIIADMTYHDLLTLFKSTWDVEFFDLKPLLEEMAILMGDKSVMQNRVGESGSFKSTRAMIEFNSLPRVTLMDDSTIAGITRDSKNKGRFYLDDTVAYYNDVGDNGRMRKNFEEVLETVYKKLYSEGFIDRNLAMKNSDGTLHLHLKTPDGFKCKFNSVRPLFAKDNGQTEARVQTINVPSLTREETIELTRSGKLGEEQKTKRDPRYFKIIFEAYMKNKLVKKNIPDFDAYLTEMAIEDNNGEVNMHKISITKYINQQMQILYQEDYNTLFFDREYSFNKRTPQKALQLKQIIRNLVCTEFDYNFLPEPQELTIANNKSAYTNKNRYNYDAFTITAVEGIKNKFITENKAQIPKLLKILVDNMEITIITKINNKNVYVLLETTEPEQIKF